MPGYGNPLEALRRAFNPPDNTLDQGPGMWPMRPKQFSMPPIAPPPVPPEFPMGQNDGSAVAGTSMNDIRGLPQNSFMERTPGGQGMGGNEWATANQGPSAGVRALSGINRPTEELYKQAANPTQTVRRGAGFAGSDFLDKPESYTMSSTAPGASQSATRELQTRFAPEDFQRLLGQKQEETTAGARTQLQPDVSAAAEAEARRSAYPQQASAEGAQGSALLNFLGREKTAEGSMQSQQIAAGGRHIAAIIGAQQRLLSNLATSEVPDEDRQLIMQRLDQMDKQKQALMQLQETYGLTDEDIDGLLGEDEYDLEEY